MLHIQNKILSLNIRPLGAKITSLKHKGKELLFTPDQRFQQLSPKSGDIFDEKFAWGADICAPSISACEVKTETFDMNIDDHGDFWTSEFEVINKSNNSIILKSRIKEFVLEIIFKLNSNSLVRTYNLQNITKHKLPFIFADHLLLPINKSREDHEYLSFPGIDKFDIEYSYDNKIGQKGDKVDWPLNRTKPFADKLFSKLHQQNNNKNYVSYSNNDQTLKFSSDKLAYIGYWHTEGGWNSQYNLGLELTNSNRDNLNEAIENDTAWFLNPQETKSWNILLDVK